MAGRDRRRTERYPTASIPVQLSDINAESPSLYLGWEALARQNARVGARDMDLAATDEETMRFRPMVYIGSVLGRRAGPEQK